MTQSLPTWLIVAVKTSPTAEEHAPLVIVPAAALAVAGMMTGDKDATTASIMKQEKWRCFLRQKLAIKCASIKPLSRGGFRIICIQLLAFPYLHKLILVS
jgi:hypothetical protein